MRKSFFNFGHAPCKKVNKFVNPSFINRLFASNLKRGAALLTKTSFAGGILGNKRVSNFETRNPGKVATNENPRPQNFGSGIENGKFAKKGLITNVCFR